MGLRSFVIATGVLTTLSLTWTVLEGGSEWLWPALRAAPVLNLLGAGVGVLFARGERGRLAGGIGVALSTVVLLFNGAVLLALYGLSGALN
jgi:hypothetical protein